MFKKGVCWTYRERQRVRDNLLICLYSVHSMFVHIISNFQSCEPSTGS